MNYDDIDYRSWFNRSHERARLENMDAISDMLREDRPINQTADSILEVPIISPNEWRVRATPNRGYYMDTSGIEPFNARVLQSTPEFNVMSILDYLENTVKRGAPAIIESARNHRDGGLWFSSSIPVGKIAPAGVPVLEMVRDWLWEELDAAHAEVDYINYRDLGESYHTVIQVINNGRHNR